MCWSTPLRAPPQPLFDHDALIGALAKAQTETPANGSSSESARSIIQQPIDRKNLAAGLDGR